MDARDRIFELLDAQKIEQKSFAAEVGVSEVIVTNWRKGRSQSYKSHIVQIAKVLGTTSEYLLTGKTQSSPSPQGDRLPELVAEIAGLTAAEQEAVKGYVAILKSLRKQ
nr:MAG TPA: transcriptional repressor DicA [Caudoviricetes sp.]